MMVDEDLADRIHTQAMKQYPDQRPSLSDDRCVGSAAHADRSPVFNEEQRRLARMSTFPLMSMTDDVDHLWDDTNELPLSQGDQRKARIAELLTALADMRPARRRDDAARFTRIEAELVLLLDAALIGSHQKHLRAS